MPKSQLAGWLLTTVAVAFLGSSGRSAQGQDDALLKKIEAMRTAPASDWAADEAAARGEFSAAWNDFKTYLDASGPAVRSSWEAFLEWQLLQRISDPALKLDGRSIEPLERLRRQFRQNAAGFEYAPFARVRAALDRLAGVAMRSEGGDLAAAYGGKIDELIAALKAQTTERTEATRMDAVAALDWLGRTRTAPGL